jgi:hypothetical protein
VASRRWATRVATSRPGTWSSSPKAWNTARGTPGGRREDFHDPEADQALFDALRANVDDEVELVEMDTDINDDEFAETVAVKLDEYMREAGVGPDGHGEESVGS